MVTGEQLRRIRERLGLTQAQFAPRLGVTANSLARLERGERRISETLALLAHVVAKDAAPRRPRRR
jgi:transcriptional regulator with XRE-family HTH domain